jgi:4,5-DOPA dioxygenase extradiol
MVVNKNSPSPSGRMPVLFIGHGSPMNVMLQNDFTGSLNELGATLPRPKAVLVVSAHWLTRGTFVTCESDPKQIYDFYGFPPELYRVRYRPTGSPEHARLVTRAVKKASVRCETEWGLDHASWAVLHHMFPEADIPVIEMSLDVTRDESYHYELGRELSGLRREGVLILGSGNIVHNLRIFDPEIDAPAAGWSVEIDGKVKQHLIHREHEPLIHWRGMGRNAALAVPTNDHYLPMLYAIALQEPDEEVRFTFEGIQNGTISMRCFRIGCFSISSAAIPERSQIED